MPTSKQPPPLSGEDRVDQLLGEARYGVMQYRCVATSLAGFLQQLTVSYLSHGYWFYVTGCVPEGKDPELVDAKLIAKYGISVSRWARARRKKAGLANLQYIRYRRFFVLLATHGKHQFFEEEADRTHDARKRPITFWGYSVSYRQGHPHVRIQQTDYSLLKVRMLDAAVRQGAEELWASFRELPYEPYAPARRQLLNILRAVNRRRKLASLPLIEVTCIRMRRHICRPFGSTDAEPACQRPGGHTAPAAVR